MQVNVQTAPAVFNFAPDLSLRVFDADGNPWFVAADIEKMFGLTNLRKRITSLDDDEKTTIASPSGGSLTLVNESGMWTLVLRSDAAIQKGTVAYKARKWVTSEVLPAIRKQGRYECPIATITPAQQLAIREAVAKRAKDVSANYQTIYRAIYARFQVPRYTEILAKDFDKAIEFIRTVDLTVPAVPEKAPEPKQIPEKQPQVLASVEFCEHIRHFVYCWRYLFRKEFDLIYQTMRAMESPHAPMLWEAIHDLNLAFVERDLEKIGFPVKELACYQHWALTHEVK